LDLDRDLLDAQATRHLGEPIADRRVALNEREHLEAVP
jgi:hypothetical protein